MPAAIHILPCKEPVLDRAVRLVLESGAPLERAAVVFASARALSEFAARFLELTGRPASAGPYLHTIDNFITGSLMKEGPAIPSELERRVILREAIHACRAETAPLFKGSEAAFLDDFLSFSSVGDRLLRFFDEVMVERIGFDQMKQKALYSDFEAHVTVLEAIWQSYVRLLEQNGCTDRCLIKTGAGLDSAFLQSLDFAVVAVPGFLTRSEADIFRRMAEAIRLELLITHDGPLPHQYRELADALGVDLPPAAGTSPLPELHLESCPDAVTEAAFVAWAVEDAVRKGIPEERIAIVLPDEDFLGILLSVMDRRRLNIAMGLPMSTLPHVTLLRCLHNLMVSMTGAGLSAGALVDLASHPFMKNRHRQGPAGRESSSLRTWIEDGRRLRVRLEELGGQPDLAELKAEVTKALDLVDGTSSLGDLAAAVMGWLSAVEENLQPGFLKRMHDNRDIRKGRERLLEILATIALTRLSKKIEGKNSTGLLETLLAQIEGETYPAVNREGKIHVIGLLETRSLAFDAVILPDLNEGILPRPSAKDMFLNTAIRQALGLPTPEDRETLFGTYVRQLLCGSRAAYLSWVDSDDRGLRSRFVEEILRECPSAAAVSRPDVHRHRVVPGRFAPPPPPRPAEKSGAALERLRSMAFSASSIRNYLLCPYRFYLEKVCRLREPGSVTPEFPADLKGSILHEAIRRITEEVPADDLFASPEAHHRHLCRSIDEVALPFDPVRLVPTNRFSLEGLKARLFGFSVSEAARYDEGWRIRHTECELTEVPFRGLYRLRGRIDRIDERDGRLAILDYKTGTLPSKKSCRLDKGRGVFTEIQLPFYLLLSDLFGLAPSARVEDLLFYDLKGEFRPVRRHDEPFELGVGTYLDRFGDFLAGVLDEIHDPAVPFALTPASRNCDYCPFGLICRGDEVESP